MNIKQTLTTLERKAWLSTLWIFILLNMLFRDIRELLRPGYAEQLVNGTFNGAPVSEMTLFVAGILLELGLLMVILSRVLNVRLNRWTNIIVGAIFMVSIIVTQKFDLDDYFFATVEVAALSVIIWLAWRWPRPEPGSVPALKLNPIGD